MRLRALDIQQLPGTGAFRVDGLAPGANLVIGPNAVGKTSLTRALCHLLHVRPDDPAALGLAADLGDGTTTWRVQRAGSQIVWTREGRAVDPPALPDPDQLHCYFLRVEDLLKTDGGGDAALVRHLRNTLSGGFDLDAIRASAPFDHGPQTGRKQAATLQEARKARQRIESEQEALRREAAGLSELESQAAAAERASRQVEQLDRALLLLEAYRERRAAETRLERFHADMARLRGNELDALTRLDHERQQCADEIEQQQRARQHAAQRLAETGLAKQWPDESELQAQRDHLAEHRRCSEHLEAERQRLAEWQGHEQRAAEALGDSDAPPPLDPACVGEVQALAGRAHRARLARDEHQVKLDTATDDPVTDNPGTARPWLAWAALAAIGAGGAAAAAVFAADPRGLAAAGVAATAGLIGLIAAARRARAAQRGADYRDLRRRELERQLAAAESTLTDIERECRGFCTRHGIDPARFEGAALERFVHLASDLDQARAGRIACERKIAEQEARITNEACEVRTFLAQWGMAPRSDDAIGLKAALDALAARCKRASEAATAQRDAERALEGLHASLAGIDARIAQLYADAGLEAGARATLEARCAAYEEWAQWRDAHKRAANIEDERRRPLAEERTLIDRVKADDERGLRDERERLARQAGDRDRLHEQIIDLRHRLDQAGRERQLEQAAAAEERAREALAEQFDQAMLAEAGRFLLDEVAAEYRNEHEPAVLQDARTRFARFTHHAWSLEIDPEHGFHAIEHASEERRMLTELSSGTRMQLLLAVRIAWARQIEREKASLPLFLDEALTTSDEARFAEVAASLEQLVAEEGRQVIYLSARRQEAALWERATGRVPHLIDLAAIRFRAAEMSPDDYALPPADTLPEPGTQTPEAYAARLGVPRVDPRQPAASVHLFYLLRDDLVLLHSLMEHWRILHLGALEALLATESAATAIPDARVRGSLAARCRAARHWTALWREGRGKPVDRAVLETSEAVTPTFIDRLAGRAAAVGGDADALIESLRSDRIENFGKTRIERLEDWLRNNGYIETTEPLDAEERARRTVQATAGHGRPEDLRQAVRWLEAGVEQKKAGVADAPA